MIIALLRIAGFCRMRKQALSSAGGTCICSRHRCESRANVRYVNITCMCACRESENCDAVSVQDAQVIGLPQSAVPQLPEDPTKDDISQAADKLRRIMLSFESAAL